jgi:DNA invertase Pin-like site-specific DNA recombinase
VLAEALDRISRDQADVATLFKQLRFAGVPIVMLAEGENAELHVGLKGTINALFLKDVAAKTHRGLWRLASNHSSVWSKPAKPRKPRGMIRRDIGRYIVLSADTDLARRRVDHAAPNLFVVFGVAGSGH